MTPEAQRIAIADACGWREVTHPFVKWVSPTGLSAPDYGPPDYTTDLNAMHEAEKVMTEKQFSQYPVWLAKVIAGTQNKSRASGTRVFCGQRFLICATPAQRAEAFLRTLSKWDDSK